MSIASRLRSLTSLLPASLVLGALACAPSVTPAPVAPPAPTAAPVVRAPAAEPPAAPLAEIPETPAAQAEIVPAAFAVPRERVRPVVLVYHMLNGLEDEMSVEPAVFEEQMRWLADHHVTVVRTSDLVEFLEGKRSLPERTAVIQIDDGHQSAYSRAYPVLKRHGYPFTLALTTQAIEAGYPNVVSWNAVREMLSSGLCELASHSHIHGHMDRLTEQRNQTEVSLSRSIIEERTGVRPESFVFPFGGNSDRVRRMVESAGYRAAFAVGGIPARADSPRYQVPRVSVLRSLSMGAFARFFREPAGVAKASSGAPRRG